MISAGFLHTNERVKQRGLFGAVFCADHLCAAICAYKFSLEGLYISRIIAENAGRMIFLENDAVFLNKNLQRVSNGDIQRPTDFDRQNYASQFIEFTNNTGRLHAIRLPLFRLLSIKFCYMHILKQSKLHVNRKRKYFTKSFNIFS